MLPPHDRMGCGLVYTVGRSSEGSRPPSGTRKKPPCASMGVLFVFRKIAARRILDPAAQPGGSKIRQRSAGRSLQAAASDHAWVCPAAAAPAAISPAAPDPGTDPGERAPVSAGGVVVSCSNDFFLIFFEHRFSFLSYTVGRRCQGGSPATEPGPPRAGSAEARHRPGGGECGKRSLRGP